MAGKPAYRVNNTAGNFRSIAFTDITVSFTFSVNISAAGIGRTAGTLAPLPIWQPPGCGKLGHIAGNNRFRKKCGVCHYIIGVNGENFTSHLRHV